MYVPQQNGSDFIHHLYTYLNFITNMLTVERKMLHYTVYTKQNVTCLLKNCKGNKNMHITDII
jgi:hypothetical protein